MPLWLMLRFPSLVARTQHTKVTLGPPFAPPMMSRADVIAEATRVCSVLCDHPHSIEYGSYHDWATRRATVRKDGTTTWATAPAFDAWKVTVRKLALPRPGGRRGGTGGQPPAIRRLVIVIDDKAGTYYAAHGM